MVKIVSSRSLNIAGALTFVFAVQFTVMLFVVESLYPNYSIANNYISDLGVGSTGFLFDCSISALGVAVIISSYFIYRGFNTTALAVLVALTGLGALLVGIFNENFGSLHGYVSDLTFVMGPAAAIYSSRFEPSPLKYMSIVLGAVSYLAIIFFLMYGSPVLGVGGWERMIVYPFLLWGVGFGAYLMGLSGKKQSSGVPP